MHFWLYFLTKLEYWILMNSLPEVCKLKGDDHALGYSQVVLTGALIY
jgi:hypothetical protein